MPLRYPWKPCDPHKSSALSPSVIKNDWSLRPIKIPRQDSNTRLLTFFAHNSFFTFSGVGTSSNPCRDTYHGPRPFSEIEVRNVARYLYKNRRNLIGYMDIHAYSQLWMTPWGYKRAYPKDYTELVRDQSILIA